MHRLLKFLYSATPVKTMIILRKRNVPDDWSEAKRRQKDTDARWTKHKGKKHFGYKNHVKADKETKLVMAFKVTSANVQDSQVIESLLEKEDAGEPVYADSTYRSESIEQMYVYKRVESFIHVKGYRNTPLSTN